MNCVPATHNRCIRPSHSWCALRLFSRGRERAYRTHLRRMRVFSPPNTRVTPWNSKTT